MGAKYYYLGWDDEKLWELLNRPQHKLRPSEYVQWQYLREDYRQHLSRIATEEGHLIDG